MEMKKEHWLHLCELAANEQDPAKLLELVKEINLILQEKEARLHRQRDGSQRHMADREGSGSQSTG